MRTAHSAAVEQRLSVVYSNNNNNNNNKAGKPYNAADARYVDFPNFRGKGTPMVVDIGGVRQGVSELLHTVYTKP